MLTGHEDAELSQRLDGLALALVVARSRGVVVEHRGEDSHIACGAEGAHVVVAHVVDPETAAAAPAVSHTLILDEEVCCVHQPKVIQQITRSHRKSKRGGHLGLGLRCWP